MKKLEPLTKEKIKKEVLNRFKWKVDKKLEKIGDNNFIQTKHVVSLIKCFNDNLAKAIDLTIEKTTKDVKSAVQGLLKEIEREQNELKEQYKWLPLSSLERKHLLPKPKPGSTTISLTPSFLSL